MFKRNMGKIYYHSTKIKNEIGFNEKKLKTNNMQWVWNKLAIESLFLAYFILLLIHIYEGSCHIYLLLGQNQSCSPVIPAKKSLSLLFEYSATKY